MADAQPARTLTLLLVGKQGVALFMPDINKGLTYEQVQKQVERVGAIILSHAGLKKGDAVSIVLNNSLSFVVTFLATTNSRLVAAPLNQV